MKRCLFILSAVISIWFAHSPLQIQAQSPNQEEYYQRLFYLCKIWGHAKYYHSEIAKGKINWDDELLKTITAVKSAPSNDAYNDLVLDMLRHAGTMQSSNAALPAIPDSLNNNTDLSWIQSPIISDSVRNRLIIIKNKFRPQTNVYVVKGPGYNEAFVTDNQYFASSDYPSEEIRLLGLFRYWNIIHYFYPYKKILDQNWDVTLSEFIPQISDVTNAVNYHLIFRELTTRINDSHSFFISPPFQAWIGIPIYQFETKFIENEMVITKVAPYVTGVARGDIIKAVNDQGISQLRNDLIKYVAGSNTSSVNRDLNTMVLSRNATNLKVTAFNGSSTYSNVITSSGSSSPLSDAKPSWSRITSPGGCNFGVVDMGLLFPAQVSSMFNELKSADAIIFDCRNYPNETLTPLVNYFFTKPIRVGLATTPDASYPGRFTWTAGIVGQGTPSPYRGKVIIIFDERTQSQAEYTIMGLGQFPGAIKIGSQTAGADGNISHMNLTANMSAVATFLGIYYPDYKPTQRIGIIPDIEMHPTIAGIKAGRDELMDFALSCSLIGIQELKLFPNPASTAVNYDITPADGAPVTIEIFDISGRLLKKFENSKSKDEIDLSEISGGMYFARITTGSKQFVSKFIKK